MEEVFRCEIASNSLTDTGLRIYDRDSEIGKEHGLSRSFGLCKNGLRFSCKKAGSVYDLIAKIWAETDPAYDLPATDTGSLWLITR